MHLQPEDQSAYQLMHGYIPALFSRSRRRGKGGLMLMNPHIRHRKNPRSSGICAPLAHLDTRAIPLFMVAKRNIKGQPQVANGLEHL